MVGLYRGQGSYAQISATRVKSSWVNIQQSVIVGFGRVYMVVSLNMGTPI